MKILSELRYLERQGKHGLVMREKQDVKNHALTQRMLGSLDLKISFGIQQKFLYETQNPCDLT